MLSSSSRDLTLTLTGKMHSYTQSVSKKRTALPGRGAPFEHRFGIQPDISHIRIFGCEALAYVEKEKRTKLDYKTEKCIYLGMSPRHSADTHKLLSLQTNQIIYRRNVSFNERSFPARNTPITRPIRQTNDTGEDLIGQTFILFPHETPPLRDLFGKQTTQEKI